jgi:hypothetical protein
MVQIRTTQILTFALLLAILPASLVNAQDAAKRTAKDLRSSPVKLQVDPLLIAEAAEVWTLITRNRQMGFSPIPVRSAFRADEYL